MAMEKRVFEETGEHTLYTVNVSDNLPKMFETAKRAVDAGANAIMVNYLAVGLPAMQALAEDPDINVPILAHMDCAGALYESPISGIVVPPGAGQAAPPGGRGRGRLPGPLRQGALPQGPLRADRRCHALTPCTTSSPRCPCPRAASPRSWCPTCVADLGPDIMIGSGGGIHAHPMGPTAGAKAFRQAIDATMQGIPIQEYAKDHQELGVALGLWEGAFAETTAASGLDAKMDSLADH